VRIEPTLGAEVSGASDDGAGSGAAIAAVIRA
jgi:hypothetical protein